MLRPPPPGARRNWLVFVAGTVLAIGAGLLVAHLIDDRPAPAPGAEAAP